jgi:hypothetical protein
MCKPYKASHLFAACGFASKTRLEQTLLNRQTAFVKPQQQYGRHT